MQIVHFTHTVEIKGPESWWIAKSITISRVVNQSKVIEATEVIEAVEVIEAAAREITQ